MLHPAHNYVKERPNPTWMDASFHPEDLMSVADIPCPSTRHPYPSHHLFIERRRLLFNSTPITSAEESKMPFMTVIYKVWDAKFNAQHMTSKTTHALLDKFHFCDIAPWLLECFVMMALGSYHEEQTPCLNWEIRDLFLCLWRSRYVKEVFQLIATKLARSCPLEVYFAVKEFIHYTIRDEPCWESWMCNLVGSGEWFGQHHRLLQVTNTYRNHLTQQFFHSTEMSWSVRIENTWNVVNAFFAKAIRRVRQPCCFFEYTEKTCAPLANSNPAPYDDLVTTFAEMCFEPSEESAVRVCPSSELETRYMDSYQIHPFNRPVFLFTYRMYTVLYLLLRERGYEINIDGVTRMVAWITVYSNCARVKPAEFTTWKRMKQLYSKECRLMGLLSKAKEKATMISAYLLPSDWVRAQAWAIKERFFDYKDALPRCDYMFYCPNCGDICASITQHTARGATKPLVYDPKRSAGYEGIKEDVTTGKLYCGRKTGLKAAVCRDTEVRNIPMMAKWLVYHKQTYLICGNQGCANLFQLDLVGADARTTVTPSFQLTTRGPMCAHCVHLEELAEQKRAKQMASELRRRKRKEAAVASAAAASSSSSKGLNERQLQKIKRRKMKGVYHSVRLK